MNDLISRQDAIDALEREKVYCTAYKEGYAKTDFFKQYNMGLTDGIKALNKLPSAQKKGKWKCRLLPTIKILLYCSECGWSIHLADNRFYNFCPNCGAEMERGTE